MATILEPGEIEAAASSPPFLHLPPRNLFTLRALRLERLAEGHPLADYLRLVAGLCHLQQNLMDAPPANVMLDPVRLKQCQQHGLPPFAADTLVREDAWLPYLHALLQRYQPPAQPAIEKAVTMLRNANAGQLKAWGISLVSGQYALLPAALVPFLGAALQACWSHWLLDTPNLELKPGDSLSQCPACGSPAMAGVIRHRAKYNGLRYLVCSLCACEWHVVRVKCVYCEQSKGLDYVSLEDDRHAANQAPLRAEICPGCNSYLKQIYLENDAEAEALSADLSSLILDMRLEQEGYQRLAPNLLLAPGGD
ncbi:MULTISPECIES: formate dehydrogenase accessory protein FdhE [unclassified Pseudomonas]|uniref:formate dehydrogenase accessory protein FdhE n=1 Tax=unclassified Pseudomonas TaxID=196821 RepID=UPI002AC8BBAC|nr:MULTISPECIES: formate dehydrogenase accessory protein FdhE [unclassified Pseudomonas]MEB0045119.1 formate dehydrogenase accessory protein FdhE [Pseudomonas sp. Dout3]MEB0096527.1 formate dehydrogenase accessory protein FdhE [Pseudomonas sp. DC1.2]WPX61477.1 formate dehydrogenase accessory protein FdhE [Pseudomonas sp. DC1.2]